MILVVKIAFGIVAGLILTDYLKYKNINVYIDKLLIFAKKIFKWLLKQRKKNNTNNGLLARVCYIQYDRPVLQEFTK